MARVEQTFINPDLQSFQYKQIEYLSELFKKKNLIINHPNRISFFTKKTILSSTLKIFNKDLKTNNIKTPPIYDIILQLNKLIEY